MHKIYFLLMGVFLDTTEHMVGSLRPAILDIHHENASCTNGGKAIHNLLISFDSTMT